MANLQVGVAGNGTVTVGAGASVHSPASNELTLGTNNAERVRINSLGEMSIGGQHASYAYDPNNYGNPSLLIAGDDNADTYITFLLKTYEKY